MITYHNHQQHDAENFSEYLKGEGYSHSWVKQQISGLHNEIVKTEKMQLGSLVDDILTAPAKANMKHELYDTAKLIAAKIQDSFPYIQHFQKQAAFSAVMRMYKFEIKTKGRLDYFLPKVAVIDLKVTQVRIHTPEMAAPLIKYMGYDNQLWHYANLAQVPKAYLLIHSMPVKKTHLIAVDVSTPMNDFWANAILNFGKVFA